MVADYGEQSGPWRPFGDGETGRPAARGVIHELFTAQATRTPEAVAVVCGGTRHTYADIEMRSNRLAHAIRRRGVGPEVSVGVCLARSAETIVAFLAVLKAGGVFAPLDPEYPPHRLSTMVSHARIGLVVTTSETAGRINLGSAAVFLLDREEAAVAQEPTGAPANMAEPHGLACMFFTSGSTGAPKCVMATHANYWNYFEFWRETYLDETPMRCHLQMAGVAFVIFVADVTRALFTGATLVICPKRTMLWPADLYDLMVRERVNSAEFVPAVLTMLVKHLERTGRTLEFMALLVAGGDMWFTHDYERVLRLCSPSTQVVAAYGMTETAIDNATLPRGELPGDATSIVPAGRPAVNTELYVLDDEGQEVPQGCKGELYVGGLGVARGYLGMPARTAERFVPDPFGSRPGARLYRTGDLCRRRADGIVEILGRIDNQVKVNGVRIEPGEVEATLLGHPLVEQAAVVAHRQTVDRGVLIGYIVLRGVSPETEKATADSVRDFLSARLPAPIVPQVLVPVDDLPLNTNGKVDRRELAGRVPVLMS